MILEIKNVKKYFLQADKKIEVLRGVDMSISSGETVAILGQSGSGKSTLLSLLAGIADPDEGEVFFEDKSLQNLKEQEITKLRSNSIGIIFQQFHLLTHLKAVENVSLALDIIGEKDSESKAADYLKLVGLEHRKEHLPSELSGGEKQRVAIARSMACSPKLLLADEPSGSLDEKTGAEVMELLFGLVKEKGMAMILVTHNRELAAQCDRVLELDQGQLVNR